jgi:IgA-specific serine endopeptidase
MSANAAQTGELLEQPQPTSAIVEYTQTEKALADLRGRLKSVVFDVTTTAGDKVARAARKECVTLRTALEDKRLELNAKDHERIKGRNLEAKRITGEIEALEGPIDQQIKAEEKRKDDERKAREEAERQRIADIQNRIENDIRQAAFAATNRKAAEIEVLIRDVVAIEINESFAEFRQQAEGAKATTLIRLRAAHTNAVNMEAEQARLAAERIENERIRQENEAAAKVERDRLAEAQRLAREELERERLRQQAAADVERARIAEEERVAKAARDAEAARQAEALRLQREESDRIERERQEAREAEDRRIAAERAEAQRIEAERQALREAEEQRLADARAQLERDQEALRLAQERAAAPAPVDIPATESASVAQESVAETVTPESEPLTASLDLKVYLAMEAVCIAAKEWAAFQHPDSKADQKRDRNLAVQARQALNNLLVAVEQLP